MEDPRYTTGKILGYLSAIFMIISLIPAQLLGMLGDDDKPKGKKK